MQDPLPYQIDTQTFEIKPDQSLNLSAIDADGPKDRLTKPEARKLLKANIKRLDELQQTMYAEHKHSLLVVFQGLDASGKDGVIRRVFSGVNPAGCRVKSFKEPTPEALNHDFLWRIHRDAPEKGMIAVFNRSHYEDVLIVRVHNLVDKSVWSKRFDFINEFERLLSVDNNTHILKFFLHISKDEQLERFGKRLNNPAKNWKISDADYAERKHWDAYTQAFEEAISRTTTLAAPWFVIPSNRKWFRDLAVSQIIADRLAAIDMKMPKPSVDMEEIRKAYHKAKHKQDGKA